jgi:hypothetical protein
VGPGPPQRCPPGLPTPPRPAGATGVDSAAVTGVPRRRRG